MTLLRASLILSIFISLALLINYISAPQGPSTTVLEGKTMGTFWRVSMINISPSRINQLRTRIQTQLDNDDQLLSIWKKDSFLMNFNLSNNTSPYPISEAMADIITKSLRIGYRMNGAMDITIGPLVNLWGFGTNQQPVTFPTKEKIDRVSTYIGLHHLTVINKYGQQYLKKDIPDLFIDLSTVGEGYAADHLAGIMEQEGIVHYLISVGGALVSHGMNATGKPWRIAIQKPTDEENEVQTIVNISGHGISTAGSYRNYYELNGKRISHIIDPRTGRPIEHNLVSVTVIASTALEADTWDTGLMVLGIEKAKEVVRKQGLAAYMIVRDGSNFKTWISPQFQKYLAKM